MQKKIIALAIGGLLSGAAFAQSNVTISGLMKMGMEQYKLTSVPAGLDFSTENRVSDQSSRLIFSGNENLGNGMTAFWQVDSRFAPDLPGGTWAGGNTFLGIGSDSLGRFAMGKADVHYGENGGLESNRAGSLQTLATAGIMSQNQVGGAPTTVAVGSRAQNVFWWDSPNWNGITARLGGSTNGAANEGPGLRAAGAADPGKGGAKTAALRYANGPLVAGLSWFKLDAEGAQGVGDQKSTRLWGGYTFPMGLKLGLVWDSNEVTRGAVGALTQSKRNAWMIPLTYSMGNHNMYLTYAKANNTSGSATAAGTDYRATQYTLGYDYALSKRTSAGVFYTKLDNASGAAYQMFGLGVNGATANTTAGPGTDSSQLYLGLAHTF